MLATPAAQRDAVQLRRASWAVDSASEAMSKVRRSSWAVSSSSREGEGRPPPKDIHEEWQQFALDHLAAMDGLKEELSLAQREAELQEEAHEAEQQAHYQEMFDAEKRETKLEIKLEKAQRGAQHWKSRAKKVEAAAAELADKHAQECDKLTEQKRALDAQMVMMPLSKTGIVSKRTNGMWPSWQSRWMTISAGHLTYAKAADIARQGWRAKVVPLRSSKVTGPLLINGRHCFHIKNKHAELTLAAESEEDLQDWLACVNQQI